MLTVSPETHGLIDYVTGALLSAKPEVLGFRPEHSSASAKVPKFLGLGLLAQNALTTHGVGVLRFLPMRMHLMTDYAAAAACLAAPLLLVDEERRKNAWVPFVLTGAALFTLAALTRSREQS